MANKFQNATPNGPKKTGSDVWLTPPNVIEKIGPFDLDPCAWLPNDKPIVQTAKKYFTEKENGLEQKWEGMVFVNFPYSQSYQWLKKCKDEYLKGDCEIIVLCFVRSETKAWQENVPYATGINLINKRIKFLDKNGIEKGNGNAPSCLIAFGNDAFERIEKVDGIICSINGKSLMASKNDIFNLI